MQDAIEEKEEQDERNMHLIIINITESGKRSEKDRTKDDTGNVMEVLKKIDRHEDAFEEISFGTKLRKEMQEGKKDLSKYT